MSKDEKRPNPEVELEARIAEWGAAALGDEEHIAFVARALYRDLSDPESPTRTLLAAGTLTLDTVARAASLMTSIHETDRNYGGAPAVAKTVVGLLPPTILEGLE